MTANPNRSITSAGELTVGQHIVLRSDVERVCRVEHVHPYADRQVIALLTPLDDPDGAPLTRQWGRSACLNVATERDIANAGMAGRRARLVAAVHELADDIERLELPVPDYRADFTILPGTDYGPWAEYLGTEVRIHPDGFPTVKRRSEVLEVSVIGEAPAKSERHIDNPERKPLEVDAAIAAAQALEPKLTGQTAECGCVIEYSPIENRERVAHDTTCRDR